MFLGGWLFLFFWNFGCPQALVLLPFWISFRALGLWKNGWKCLTVIHFRDLTASTRSSCAGLDCGCVLMLRFCRVLWFVAVLRLTCLDLLVLIVVKKEFWKNIQKVSKKGSAGHKGKTVSGGVGPFKNKKTSRPTSQQWDIASNTPQRA